jgi:hypothetical protein
MGLQVAEAAHPTAVDGDRLLIERLVANLFDNAVRHNMPGRRIEITTSNEHSGGRGECRQAEPAGAKRPERVHFLAGCGQAAGYGVCVAEQPGAGFGQCDTPGAAQGEREPQVAFEALNVLSGGQARLDQRLPVRLRAQPEPGPLPGRGVRCC